MKSLAFLLLALLCILNTDLQAQQDLANKYDKILAEEFLIEGPGATALIAKNGKIIYKNAVGHANVELDVPMQVNNVFRIGSITKQFTAVAILMLEEQGKLSLQDEITKFIEDYPTQGKTITIEHLLTHTSGIKSYTNVPEFMGRTREDLEPMQVIDFFKDIEMEFEPGDQWNYNNSGYFILGAVIEKVAGKSYAAFIEEEIFDKLGMENSYYDSYPKIIPHRAAGYQMDDKGLKNADYLSTTLPYAAGSLLSNVEDLYKWNQAVKNHKLISEASLKKAWTPYELNNGEATHYGYGWGTGKLQGTRAIEHGGGIFGYLTQAAYLPEEDLFVAVFSNCNCQGAERAAQMLAAEAMGKPLYFEPIEVEVATLKQYEGVYKSSEEESRVILVKEGTLISKRGNDRIYNLIPIGEDEFQFEDSFTRLKFEKNGAGEIVKATSITAGGKEEVAMKTEEKPVLEERKSIKLSDEVLNQYVGTYELMKGFNVKITNENNQLMAHPTGQNKEALNASSETKFHPTTVEAEVEFFKEDGKVTHLVLKQGGREMKGKKIE
ncbi:MAG: serine hydrolase [Bacteroidota bacterium]